MKRCLVVVGWIVVALACTLTASAEPLPKTAHELASLAEQPNEGKPKKFLVEILVLHASQSAKGIDPRIGKMPELKQPPFSAYRSYELLNKARLPLRLGQSEKLVLPNQRVVRTALLEVLADDHIRISASVSQAKGGAFLPLLEVKAKLGQSFIVAGQRYQNGVLVLVFRVVSG